MVRTVDFDWILVHFYLSFDDRLDTAFGGHGDVAVEQIVSGFADFGRRDNVR